MEQLSLESFLGRSPGLEAHDQDQAISPIEQLSLESFLRRSPGLEAHARDQATSTMSSSERLARPRSLHQVSQQISLPQTNTEVLVNMATPASSSIEKPTTAKVDGIVLATPKPKALTTKKLRYAPVILLYTNYLVSQVDAQDDNLKNLTRLCRRFNWIPTIDMVNKIISDANIIDEKHRLNFPVYAFMQEFKFMMCVSEETGYARLFVGILPVEGGVGLDVWAGWPEQERSSGENITAAQTVLYNAAQAKDGASKLELNPEVREQIIWDNPFEELFQMSRIFKEKNMKSAVQVQNAILLSAAKVVIRFPGLMKVAPGTRDRLAESTASDDLECFQRPFTKSHDSSKPVPHNPYLQTLDIFKCGPSPSGGVHRCHPPDQQLNRGNKPTKSNINTLKRKRDT
jgi:hypothetical protein